MKISHFLVVIALSLMLVGCQSTPTADLTNQADTSQETQDSDQNNNQTGNFNVNSQPSLPVPTPEPSPAPVKTFPTAPVVQNPSPAPDSDKLPDYFYVYIAFASQAPYAVWDELHQEACEEASMIMAAKYFNNESLNAHIMEQEILDLSKWEGDNGFKVDVTAQETVTVLKDYFGLTGELMIPVTVEKIKQALVAGQLVIVPAAGRELGNPYFTAPGPIYHMLVIKGYDDKRGEFITNDPGTKRGADYRYQYQTLMNAIADWDHGRAEGGMTDDEMTQGRQVVITVSN